jgi:UDP:flavonoid glycosyltransferase YjiC (YdhE family)
MRIGLQTWGTDGDFMPFLALAIGLKDAGHEVTLAYTSVDGKDYSNRMDTAGIKLIRANGNVPTPDLNPYGISAKPGSFSEYSKLLNEFFEPFTDEMFAASEELCKNSDLVIGHAACHTLVTAAEKASIPRISLVLVPLVVQTETVSPIGKNFGKLINNLMWSIGDKVSVQRWYKRSQSLRQDFDLPKIKSLQRQVFTSDTGTIVASSPTLFNRPSDWKKSAHISGFLNLPEKESSELPKELSQFLLDGEPPIFMTFGSCLQFDEVASTQLILETIKLLNCRCIIQLNDSSKLGKVSDQLFITDQVPHAKVFPQCQLIVHHGGAGTTQAALLAGKPSVIVAHGFDQSYWANTMHGLGVSGRPLLRHDLEPSVLARTINEVLDSPTIQDKATALGNRMRTENGVKQAVTIINQILAK